MKKTKYFSFVINDLPKGCQYCVKGSKLVLFITGLCPRSCFYCPISEHKYKKDVTYADEWPTQDIKDIIKEAELIKAEGAGLTGGDPLVKLDRTLEYIQALKNHFGKKFHIHLYTSFDLINENTLKQLHQAGLDEIRFHPDLDNDQLWPRIELVKKFNWDIGIEIPVIPNKKEQTLKLIKFFENKINFLNLNELEIADAKHNQLTHLGYQPTDLYASTVKGSADLAKEILRNLHSTKLNVHFCTAKLKDAVQLANRLKRRAQSIKQPFDQVTEEGLLLRGAIYLPDLQPSFGYHEKLLKLENKADYFKKLEQAKTVLTQKLKTNLLQIDEQKLRLLTSQKIINQFKKEIKQLNLIPAIVEEYPTYDSLEVDIDFK